MTSLASVKGPSVTVTFPPKSRTRAPCAVGASPPLPSIVPALSASSLSFAMASMSDLGGGPWFSGCLTIIMNRIFRTPLVFGLRAPVPDGLDRPNPSSTHTSNEGQRNRHPVPSFLKVFFWVYWLGVGDALTLSAKTSHNNNVPTTTRSSGHNDINIRRKHCKKP